MDKFTIRTSGRKYTLVAPAKVPRVWARDFDYINEKNGCSPRLVKYRGRWYDIYDAMPTRPGPVWAAGVEEFADWDYYIGNSFSSGVLFRYVIKSNAERIACRMSVKL